MRPTSTIQWTAYPALLVAGAFAAGIIAAETGLVTGFRLWWGLAGAGFALWTGSMWWEQQRLVTLAPLIRTGGLALLVAAAGGLRDTVYRTPPPRALDPIAAETAAHDRAVTLLGTIADPPARDVDALRFTLQADGLVAGADTLIVNGRVRVTMGHPPWSDAPTPFPRVQAGDRLRVRGELHLGPSPRNPGDFDYGAYLRRRGVCCVLRVGIPADVAVTGADRTLVGSALVVARSYVREQLTRHVPHPEPRAVLQALLLGDRSRLSTTVEDQFAATGLMHLLAVSGLHVLLVGMVLYGLLRPMLARLRLRWRTIEVARAVATIAVLAFYMALTGARPSVVRAVVMAALLIGGIVLQRSTHTLNTLGVAMLVLLAVRPPALFDVGFQLSMAAVAGIVTLHERLAEWVPEGWRTTAAGDAAIQTTIVTVAATVATGPVLLYHFGRVPLAGLLLNIVAIPLTGLGLTAGIMTALTGSLAFVGAAFVGAAFGAAADALMALLLWMARVGEAWMGWARIPGSRVDIALLGAWTAGTVTLAQWPRPRHRWRCIAVGVCFLAAGAWTPILTGASGPRLDVTFFDVGQGDAALIRTPGGAHVLVDAGPRTRYADAGTSVLVPYLRSTGIDRLDAVVITHPDSDHLGGLPSLLQSVRVDRVLLSGWTADSRLYVESHALLDRLSIPHRSVHAGDTLRVDPSVRFDVLAPPPYPQRAGLHSENDASVVLRLVYGATTVLFTGDVEARGEAWLIAAYGDRLESDVLKVPHHGSSTSSTPELLAHAAADSSHAVISAGRGNAFGMPHAEVLERWHAAGAHVHQTMDGAVWMRSDGSAVWEVSWR
jgi:competence protein ComEC